MVLEFMELEDHGKFDFAKFEYPKSDKSLYISETIADCNIICKKMLFGYFHHMGSFNLSFSSGGM